MGFSGLSGESHSGGIFRTFHCWCKTVIQWRLGKRRVRGVHVWVSRDWREAGFVLINECYWELRQTACNLCCLMAARQTERATWGILD